MLIILPHMHHFFSILIPLSIAEMPEAKYNALNKFRENLSWEEQNAPCCYMQLNLVSLGS